MNLLWQELQFPYSRRNPSQSLGKSAVRIIYCCRTIKWLLADKSRCVHCVQQRLGPKAFTNGENVAFCAKFDSTASILHKLLSQKNSRKSRQPLPRDPWLVRSPELYNKKLINVQLWFYYRPPFLLCPLYQKLESCCLVTSNTEEQLSIIIFSIYFAELMLRRDIACIATSWLGQNFVTLGTHLQHHDLFASKQVTSNLVQVAILSNTVHIQIPFLHSWSQRVWWWWKWGVFKYEKFNQKCMKRYLTMILSGAFSLEYLVLPNQIVT